MIISYKLFIESMIFKNRDLPTRTYCSPILWTVNVPVTQRFYFHMDYNTKQTVWIICVERT